jgi:hypothetical protein
MTETVILPEGARARIKTITICETDGEAEYLASAAAERARDGRSQEDELLRRAIVAVDDEPAQQPYFALDGWSVATVAHVRAKFNELNGVTEEEVKQVLQGAKERHEDESGCAVFEFNLEQVGRVSVGEVFIREATARDGYRARMESKKRGAGVSELDELMRMCVVKFSVPAESPGEGVVYEDGPPDAEVWARWTTRTRQLISAAFLDVNSLFPSGGAR